MSYAARVVCALSWLFLSACRGLRPAAETDPGASGPGSVDSASSADTGSSTTGHSAVASDTAIEHIPPADTGIPRLCHVSISCDQAIPDEPKIDCQLTVTNALGRVYWDGPAGVELRGRSSLSAPKHQYAVELRDDSGARASANLLGMGSDDDWVLNGCYYDRSLVRNALGYDLYRAMGADGGPDDYAADFRFCDLDLNGAPQGIYMLITRIEAGKKRIDIAEDDGTGDSFVLKLDESGYLHANALGYGGWTVVSPPDTDAAQQAGISAWLDGWETAAETDPGDPDGGLAAWIDIDSAVDIVLFEEMMKNNDAWYLSLYAWKDLGGKIHFTPWDLDLTLGQPSYNDNEAWDSWILYRPDLVATFAAIPDFDQRLAERWAELRAGPLATGAVLARIDGYQQTMGDAIEQNFEIWPISSIQFGGYLYPVSSYAEEDAYVRNWVTERLAWMDDHVSEWGEGR